MVDLQVRVARNKNKEKNRRKEGKKEGERQGGKTEKKSCEIDYF